MDNSGRSKFNRYKTIILIFVKIISIFPNSLNIYLMSFFRNLSGKKGLLIRYVLFKSLAKKCGDNVLIAENVFLYNIQNIEFGSNISIHPMCYIDASGGLIIGNNVSIAHNTSILTTNHSWEDTSIPIKYNKIIAKKIEIEEDVWIGCGCRILSGTKICKRTIVAAGAVVTQNIASNTIVGGIPAKKIKNI